MRRLFVVLGASALLALGPARPWPRSPFRLDEQIVDEADVLGGRGGRVGRRARRAAVRGRHPAVRRLRRHLRRPDRRRVDARRPRSCPELGGDDALLAVAVDDRRVRLLPCPTAPTSPAARPTQLAGQAVEPEFADGNWEAGAVAFADILRTGEAPGGGGSGGGRRAARPGRRSPSSVAAPTCSCRNRRKKRAAAPPPVQRMEKPDPYAGETTEQLQFRASSALLELDEAMKTSQLDLDYARSQYGEQAVAGFDKALATVAGRALPRVHAAPAAGRRRAGGRADHAADARRDAAADRRPPPPGWTSRPAPSRSCATWRTPRRRCWRRWPRGSPSCTPASRRRSSGWPQLAAAVRRRRRSPRSRTTSTEARARLAAAEQEVQEARDGPGVGRAAAPPSATSARPRTRSRRPPRCSTPSAGSAPTWTPPAAAWRRCGPRRRRTSPRPGRSPRRGTASGLRPQIARAEAALAAADGLTAGERARPAGGAAAAGGGRHRARAGAGRRPRRADAAPPARPRRWSRRC